MMALQSEGESSVAAEPRGHPGSATAEPVSLRLRQVMDHLRKAIEERRLKPGDRVPAERQLARELNVSRGTVRLAIGSLTAMGLLRIRHSVGTFITDGPPEIGKTALGVIGALHGFQLWQTIEARRMVECGLAALAAQRARERDFAAMAEQLAEMYSACDDPGRYCLHHGLFHRSIARAAGNPVIASLMETVAAETGGAPCAIALNSGNLREAADFHREIYRSIRLRDVERARSLMEQCLRWDQRSPRAGRSGKLASRVTSIESIRRSSPDSKKPDPTDWGLNS